MLKLITPEEMSPEKLPATNIAAGGIQGDSMY